MKDLLQAKIDKYITSYDVNFEKEEHIFTFFDGTIINVPVEFSTYIPKEQATIVAILYYLKDLKDKKEQGNG